MTIINQESSVYVPIIGNEDFAIKTPDLSIDSTVVDLNNVVEMLHQRLSMIHEHGKKPVTAESVILEYSKMKHDSSNNFLFNKLDGIASSLGSNIVGVFNTIQYNVKPTVDTLKAKIEKMTSELMSENEVTDDDGNFKVNVEICDFDKITSDIGSPNDIDEMFKDMSGLAADHNLRSVSRLYNNKHFAIESISIDQATKNENINRFKKDTGIDDAEAKYVWDLVSDNRTLSDSAYDLFADSAANGNYLKCIDNMSGVMINLYPKLVAFRKFTVNTSDAVAKKIQSNLDKVFNVIIAGAYTLQCIKKIYNQNNALVIAATGDRIVLNGDVANEVNITNDTIVRHMRMHYLSVNKAVPINGVKAKEILDNKEKDEKAFEKDLNDKQLRASLNRRNYMSKAMTTVLNDYLLNTDPAKLPKGVTAAMFAKDNYGVVKSFANRLESTDDKNLQNSLFEFVINIWHRGTPIATAHKLFGEEVVRQLSINPSLESMNVNMIDMSVAVEIATDFVVNKLCSIK